MKNNLIKIVFLGTGANGGTPQIGCRCKFCSNAGLFKMRERNSILIELDNRQILVDSGPDFKKQIQEHKINIKKIDAIVLSHLHWDHSIGLLELSAGKPLNIPILAEKSIKKTMIKSDTFNFLIKKGFINFIKKIDSEIKIKFIKVIHDPNFDTFAIVISSAKKSLLIVTDISSINQELLKAAKKADLIIFDGTFLKKELVGHISIQKSSKILAPVNKNVIFTHINHSENPIKIRKFLNKFGFKLAYDNLKISI